jgi:hypothetical protein
MQIEEFPQAKEAKEVKDQDQNNVALFFDFRHQVYHPL